MTQTTQRSQFKLGDHVFRPMDGADAAFGANRRDYPEMAAIPETHASGKSKGCKVFSELFFSGGKLTDHGFTLKADVNTAEFYNLLRALMSSFAPKHEVKEATCGWLIEEYCDYADPKVAA